MSKRVFEILYFIMLLIQCIFLYVYRQVEYELKEMKLGQIKELDKKDEEIAELVKKVYHICQ